MNRSRRLGWAALGAIVLVGLVLTALHVRAYPTLSPIDEVQHVDYLTKAGRFDLPARGERISELAMREAACRGIDAPGFETPPCDAASFDPDSFPERGFNTSADQYPVYYVVTGPLARVTAAVGVVDSEVTAGRLLGAGWLALGAVLTWAAMAELGVRRRHRVAPLLLVVATPLLVFHASTINSDTALFAAGALVTWVTIRFAADRAGLPALGAAYLAAFLVEPSTMVMVAVSVAFLLLRGWQERAANPGGRAIRWRWFVPIVALPTIVLLRFVVIDRIQDARVAPRPPDAGGYRFTGSEADRVDWGRVLGQLDATFTPVARAYLPPIYRNEATLAFIFMTNWLFIAALLGMALAAATGVRSTWARVVTLALLSAGPFYTWYYAAISDNDFPAPGRFALPIVAAMVVVGATAIRNRTTEVVAGTVAVASAATFAVQLL